MAPKKKAQKISLNEFLGDSTLGSWADEMEALPNAPAMRVDDDRPHDRYATRKDDFQSARSDRGSLSSKDIPIPTQPPYTAFIGNLAFDLTEIEIEEFFGSAKIKTIKIIRDREDKPKGFGYVEFTNLDGLKDALAKSGANFSGRTIRISVAEPAKERAGFASGDGDTKFDNPWRRDRPFPDLPDARDSSRRRFEVTASGDRPSLSDGAADWRSGRPPARAIEPDSPPSNRKDTGFPANDGQLRFKSALVSNPEDSKFGGPKGRGEMPPPKSSLLIDDADWRSSARLRSVVGSSISPTDPAPPTSQVNRKKLELLPRSTSTSGSPSPLSSPKISATQITASSRSNPFGGAKPVDVTSREREVANRLEKERDSLKDRTHPISRTNSRTASERGLISRTRTPPLQSSTPSTPTSPKNPAVSLLTSVHPSLSFAHVAGAKKDGSGQKDEMQVKDSVTTVTENIAEVTM